MIKANYEETGDSVRVVHLGVGEGQGFSQKGVQPSFGRNTRKIHLIFYNFKGKHTFWMASFRCLAKSLERGTEQSYIRGALLPKIQLPKQNTHTKKQPHKWPENTNALIMTETCQMIITCTGTYMYITLFCDIVFRTYLVYFKIRCSDQILLVLCPGNMSEDVIKRVRNHSSHIWVWPHSYNLQHYNII